MVSVIIVSHGFFSKELLGSAEMIIGTQEDVQTVGFHPGESIDSLKEQMASADRKSTRLNSSHLRTI